MSFIIRLKEAVSLGDVALILGFKPATLSYILYIKKDKYQHFEIPKRSGGVRKISAPYPDLMTLQKRLAENLQNCIADINSDRNITSTLSHGFRRKYSIITNATVHRKMRYVFNVDLENFFGTINFGRVRGFFIKNRNFELNPKVATVLAQIACYENTLPQGSPCSPVISNLIAHSLDIKLVKLAYRSGCYYSRYADDLTFSTNRPSFPSSVSIRNKITPKEHEWIPGKELERLIIKSGFLVNHSKTRMQYQESRQEVTGLVVNKKVSVRQEYWRTARAMSHSLFKNGEFKIKKVTKDKNGTIIIDVENGTLNQLNGILSFIDSVDSYNKNIVNKPKERRTLNSREEVYRQFLFYKDFHVPLKPTVICEGKTDNVYIKAAMRSLHKKFPRLSETMKSGSIVSKIRLYHYTRITDRISHLAGGVSDLTTFISTYSKRCMRYKKPDSQNPVIVLIDNDKGAKGAKGFFSVARNLTGKTVDGSDQFYYVNNNLYIIVIPQLGKKDTKIEDFFEPALLKTKINGKSFNPDVPFNKDHEYSKHIFAENIVRKHQDKINFDGFSEILERIDAAILHSSK